MRNAAGYVHFNSRANQGYAQDGLFTANNSRFRETPEFQAAYARGVEASQGINPRIEWRLHVALWAARAASWRSGDAMNQRLWGPA